MLRRIRTNPLLLCLACAGESASDSSPAAWRVAEVPDLEIGADESRPGHSLFRVIGATRLSAGRVVIADNSSSELLFFGQDGTLLSRAGGMGSGPDELRNLQLISRQEGDTILVLTGDPAVAKVGPDARVLSKEPYRYPYYVLTCRFAGACGMAFLPDESMLISAEENPTQGCGPRPPARSHRVGVMLGRYHWRSGAVDTIGFYPGIDRTGPEYRAYGRYFVTAVGPAHFFAAETGGDSVAVFTHNGEQIANWSVPLQAMPVSAEAKSQAAPAPVRQPDGSTYTPDSYDYPETYPVFARILADADGNLWVMKYPQFRKPTASSQLVCPYAPAIPEAGSDWIVIDPNGKVVADVHTPGGLFVLEIGTDYVLGMRRDSLDIETVSLYTLLKAQR